jgi:hypothetical protein
MRFSEVAKELAGHVDGDELRDVAADLLDKGVPEAEIVDGLAVLVDKALPLDEIGAKFGVAGAAIGAILEAGDGLIAAMVLRPAVRFLRDPEARKKWRASRRAAREARRG